MNIMILDDETLARDLRLGIADFILKPVDGAELETALADVLYRKARSRAALQEYACNEKKEQGDVFQPV